MAARFRIVRELRRGAQASVYVVADQLTDATWVLKVYDREWQPDERVWQYLRSGRRSSAVVEIVELDRTDGRCYELMEYLRGDDLVALRGKDSYEQLGPDGLHAIVRQLTEALDDLHANGIAHRDLTPANVVVRRLEPDVEVAIVDFGISSPIGQDVRNRNGTPPYTSPQFLAAGTVKPANDWWALGVLLIEFFKGGPLYEGLTDPVAIKSRVASAPISAVAVTDARLRLLCSGLTAQAERPRWGSRQVRAWLAGEDPPVPGYAASTPDERPGGAAEPYRYGDSEYRFPDELAAAMSLDWANAASWLFRDEPLEPKRLRGWLKQFPDLRRPEIRSREPDDVRLLRVLRAMHPKHPPVYRSRPMSVSSLPAVALDAFNGKGDAPDVVRELSTYDLLRLLAVGEAAQDLAGGDGLAAAAGDWRTECDRLSRGLTGLPPDARAALDRSQRDGSVDVLAIGLLAAVAPPEVRDRCLREVQRTARRARGSGAALDWYVDLAERRSALWLAYLLVPVVTVRVERIVEEALAARRRRAWLMRTQAVREWSRRQNRPQSLAWSVAGVATLAAVWGLLIGLSDAVGFASDATIIGAWLVTVLGMAVVLAGESLLAWEIGGGFHPRYSLLGAGLVGLGRGARAALRRRAALPVLLGVVIGVGVAAVSVPVYVALAPPVLVPLWAWRRFVRWEDDRVRERAEIGRAERERSDDLARAREGVA